MGNRRNLSKQINVYILIGGCMSKKEKFFIGFFGFLIGVIVGFLISPVKKGIEIGNNSGNTSYAKEPELEEE
jgi:hypothetical protein